MQFNLWCIIGVSIHIYLAFPYLSTFVIIQVHFTHYFCYNNSVSSLIKALCYFQIVPSDKNKWIVYEGVR